jgi:hypothetical protein
VFHVVPKVFSISKNTAEIDTHTHTHTHTHTPKYTQQFPLQRAHLMMASWAETYSVWIIGRDECLWSVNLNTWTKLHMGRWEARVLSV